MARILVQAIQNGEEILAKDIIQGGTYAGKDSQTSNTVDTALLICCSRGFTELAKLLLDKGANVASTGKNKATSLHAAVDNGHLNVVRLLITHGADVNVKTQRGDTPLHLAAFRGHWQIAQCLMEAGADSTIVNGNSFTAENEAFIQGHSDLGYYLRLKGSARCPTVSDKTYQAFDSMIQLDCPSLVSNPPNHQQIPQIKQDSYYQQQQEQDTDPKALNRKSECIFRSKSSECDIGKLSNHLFIPLNPPEHLLQSLYPLDKSKSYLSDGNISRITPSHLLDSTNKNFPPQGLPYISSFTFPQQAELPPKTFPGFLNSQLSWQTEPVLKNKLSSAPTQADNRPCTYFNDNISRRPSTSSNGSCFSDISICTGSDGQSLLSSGSDGSFNFCDSLREGVDTHDDILEDKEVDTQDDVIMFESLGVRNPPAQKSIASYLTNPKVIGPPDFSNVHDSTLFSLRSKKRRPSLSSSNTPSSDSLSKVYTENVKSSQICFCSDVHHKDSCDTFYPSLNRMSSNDLSSPFSSGEKSPISMTLLNIPLN